MHIHVSLQFFLTIEDLKHEMRYLYYYTRLSYRELFFDTCTENRIYVQFYMSESLKLQSML